MRIGFGYDSHRFEKGKPLVLGGVPFPGECGLRAHSDGDVVIHAVIDALFGAASLGDIGTHFPDTDPAYANADSRVLLRQATADVRAAGYELGNLDITVVCETPRLAPHVAAMRAALADAMKTEPGRISIKGKTNEKMDDVGAALGIVTYAVVLLEDRTPTSKP